MKKLAVIILNYKTAEMTCRCADLVLEELAAIDSELIIVDNFSGDGSDETLISWKESQGSAEKVSLIFSDKNTGFSGGNNLGLKSADAEFYVLLNSDTLVRPGAFVKMLAVAEANEQVGIVAPILIGEDDVRQISHFRQFTPVSEFIAGSSIEIVRKTFEGSDIPIPIDREDPPGWVSFACVLVRKKMVDQIGMMDDGYFLYFEDADYCRTATDQGWKIATAINAKVVHLRGGSSPVKSKEARKERLPSYYYASRARFYKKFYGQAGYVSANLLWYFGRVLAHAKRLVLKRPARVCENAARDIWISSYVKD